MKSVLIASVLAVVIAGCGGTGASTGPSSPSSGPSTAAVATARLTLAPTSEASATPAPTPDIAHPVGIIAIGHSGLTGEGTAGPSQADITKSWATGTDARVDSIYRRLVAAHPGTDGNVANTARGGAGASELTAQAVAALAQVPVPELAIIQTVDNDIQCDAANVAAVGDSLAEALARIRLASPKTKILVVGQLGRPSVPFIKKLVTAHPEQVGNLTWGDDCSFFDAKGEIQPDNFKRLTAAIDAYEAETARVCATVPTCATDGGIRRAWVDKLELFSSDFAHLNITGQAAVADNTWPAVVKLLGL